MGALRKVPNRPPNPHQLRRHLSKHYAARQRDEDKVTGNEEIGVRARFAQASSSSALADRVG